MNAEGVAQYLVNWLQEEVSNANAKGVVLGVSGGIDSAVAAVIAHKAFGDNSLAIMMPCESHLDDLLHGKLLVETFNIPHHTVELDNAYTLLTAQYESHLKLDGEKGRLLRANIKPRLRMTTLYYAAQAHNYLVVGTSNKSEINIGYATKYGDSGVDLQILGDLLKKEVYQLARYLDIPQVIIDKPPSAGLWSGQTDENEMGITYEKLDKYLETGEGEPEVIEKIDKMHRNSAHKRRLPPIAIIPEKYR